MKDKFPYILIVILFLSLLYSFFTPREVVVEKVTRDTITVNKIDTVICYKPKFISEKVKDTIVIEKVSQNVLKLPLTQRYYSTDKYKAWVSGYNPTLDSIIIFNNTKTNIIATTIEKRVYPKTTDLYLNAGGMMIKDRFAPNIGASIKFRNDMFIGANIGYYDESVIYGFNIGIKIK